MHDPIKSHHTSWQALILSCGKCARKLDGGYGQKGHDTLRATLRAAIKSLPDGNRPRVIETKCLGICPKGAVAALNASAPGNIYVIPAGTAAETALKVLLQTEENH